jgi:hypothetical protein
METMFEHYEYHKLSVGLKVPGQWPKGEAKVVHEFT